MKNEKLRQKKIAKNKKKRLHHNKTYDHRQRCDYGNYKSKRQQLEHEKIMKQIADHFAI